MRTRRRHAVALPLTAVVLAALVLGACGRDEALARGGEAPAAFAEPDETSRTTASDSLYALGMELYGAWEMDSARVVFGAALDEARRTADPAAEARALTRLGLAAWRLGEHAAARRLGEQALALKLEHGLQDQLFDSYNALGLLAWYSESRYAEALERFGRAQELAEAVADTEKLAKVWSNLGNIHTDLGQFSEARRLFPMALEAARRVEDPLIEGRVLTNLGMLAVRTGDPTSAIPYLEEAVVRSREAEDPLGELSAVAHLGTAYAGLGEIGRAIAYLDSAHADARARGQRQEEASDLEQLAELHRQMGDYPEALRLFERARAINLELDLLDEMGGDLRSEAAIHAVVGNLELARRSALEALEIHRQVGARLEILGDLLMLAELSHAAGDTRDATDRLGQAREESDALGARSARSAVALTAARIADREGDGPAALDALREGAAGLVSAGGDVEWEAHALAARAFLRVGTLDSAAAAGRRAVAVVERGRGQLGSGLLRTSYASERAEAYRDLVGILLRLGRDEEAFEVADGSRGRALLEEIAKRGPNGGATGQAPLRELAEEERQMLRSIDTLTLRIAEARGAADAEGVAGRVAELDRLYEELEEKREAYSAALVRAEAGRPGEMALLGGRRPTGSEVRAALGPGEALLQYMVTPERVLLFVVRPDSVWALSSDVPQGRLAAQVRVARELLGRPGAEPDAARSVTEALYEALLAPAFRSGALGGVDVLVIVPDAELTYLPFAALRDPATGRHVAEGHALLHLPSAGSLPALRSRPRATEARGAAVAFAPFPDDLPATSGEVRAFRAALSGSDAVRGRRASEARFREALASASIVHAATHGILNARSPLFSRLELARGDGSRPEDDGRLEIHELLDIPVAASLVFLSGCETGVGAAWGTGFSRGEDYATLARAFLYAGAENVVATLWRVEDEGAAAFAAAFYRELRAPSRSGVASSSEAILHPTSGRPISVAEALVRAQRAMMRDARFSAPYYWAGYRLSGTGTLSGLERP